MTYFLRFRPEVVGDLEDAAKWCDDRRLGLGGEFLRECKAALDRILERPVHGTVDPEGVRTGNDLLTSGWESRQGSF